MSPRVATFLCLLAAAPAVAAQSNVRPGPSILRVPELDDAFLSGSSDGPPPDGEPAVGSVAARPASFREEREPGGFTHLDLAVSFYPEAEFEDSSGSVSTFRSGWTATLGRRIEDEAVFAVTLEAEASFYDFRNATGLMAGAADPFNDVYDTRAGLLLMQDPRRAVSWFSGVELGLSGEDNASLRHALSIGVAGGARQRVDEDLSISVGLIGRSRLEDDPWIFPYIGFDWRVADRLRLKADGPVVSAVLELADDLDLELGAEYAIRQYRLNEDSSLPGGVIDDDEINASLRLGWHPSRRISLEVEAGVTLWREFATFSAGGTKLTELETDPTEFGALRLSVTL